MTSLTPQAFVEKWRHIELKERAACQEHFINLCQLINHPTPAEADPTGENFAFEYGAHHQDGGAAGRSPEGSGDSRREEGVRKGKPSKALCLRGLVCGA